MRLTFLIVAVILTGGCALAQDAVTCPYDNLFNQEPAVKQSVGVLTAKIWRTSDDDDEGRCHFEVTLPDGRKLAAGSNHVVALLPPKFVTASGHSDVILEAYSGGAHCCWTYFIVSALPKPCLVATLETSASVTFEDLKSDHHVELATYDGNFDYFDDFSYAFSPLPEVILSFEGASYRDLGPAFASRYDQTISVLATELTSEELKALRGLGRKNLNDRDIHANVNYKSHEETASKVLQIVLAYLYSGRRELAHDSLKNMWPAADQERMWALILNTRQHGLLNRLSESSPTCAL